MPVSEKPYSRIKWESVRKTYGPKMIRTMHALSERIKKELPELHAESEWELDCDSYSVVVRLVPDGREPVDVSFSICESTDYEGIEGGYTFRVDIVEDGGRIVGEFSPYNYSEQVWCKTRAAIAERFEMFPTAILADSMIEFLSENVAN